MAVTVRDRFQGALLGLELLPVALRLSGGRPIALAACSEEASRRSLLCRAIDCSLARTSDFLTAPNVWRMALTRLPSAAFLIPACVPVLLRYHYCWQSRLRWLMWLEDWIENEQVFESADGERLSDWEGAIAQVLMLGDVLERMGAELSFEDWLFWLEGCAERYSDIPFVCGQYEGILLALMGTQSGLGTGEFTKMNAHQVFAAGLWSAIASSGNYALTVRSLGECAFAREMSCLEDESFDVLIDDALKADWVAAFSAGLVAGALSGRNTLPVLWQVRLPASRRADLADELFRRWAGQSLGRGVF